MRLTALVAMALLGGCAWLGEDENLVSHKGPGLSAVLDDLPPLQLDQADAARPDREQVMAAYNRVYGLLPSARDNHVVGKRLADLHMEAGEEQDIAGAETPYAAAVTLYERLLRDKTQDEQLDEVLYQLARAHDLAGQTDDTLRYLDRLVAEHPDSEFVPEGRFRRAEILFSRDQYDLAAADYSYVVSLADETPYLHNALYMLGWSQFKQSYFEDGLARFFDLLDGLLNGVTADLAGLPQAGAQDQLLQDTFRVVTLTLGYLEGAQTLADEMRRRGKPGWQYLAYQRLADDYFERERYLDSVATWQAFVEHNSLDPRAPAAHRGMIKTLIDAGFPTDVLPKKREFIARYGVYSEFWSYHNQDVRDAYLPTLQMYLSELASLAHAEAQAFDATQQGKDRRFEPAGRRALYLAAAQWYEEIVVTFPDDPRTAHYLFLLGETYTEAIEPARAVAAYQRVVRDYPDFERAPEAGYAAILGLSELVVTAPADEHELWQRLKIDAQIEFALVFPADPRAPAVQTDAADTLFGMGHTREAMDLAENLLLEWPDADPALRRTALLIIGHGRFEAEDFTGAESAYRDLLSMQLDGDARQQVHERLLAAAYKQGEAAEAVGDVDQAVSHYLRLAQLDAAARAGAGLSDAATVAERARNTASLVAQGHFDAVAVLEGAGRLAEAANLLAEFRVAYPGHVLGRDAGIRLAALYEQTDDTAAAAGEYANLAITGEGRELRRQSQYRAGELYLELNDQSRARTMFADYADTYRDPPLQRLEAMHHVDLLCQESGDAYERRIWLQKKVDLHRQLGRDANERATYLAAEAQYVLADHARVQFNAIRLTHPLPKSLKDKQRALKQALSAYEQVAGYEVAAFTTASTFQIADLYTALSSAIMSSDRPGSLSTLELEQYDILLEEQAFPFEEQAITLHEINLRRAWGGVYDEWIQRSFAELARLMPGRFNKPEHEVAYAESIH